MAKYKWQNGEMVEVAEQKSEELHAVHDDTIDPIMSHATEEGLMFDSKSAYKRHLDEHGFEITGGDHLTGRPVSDFEHETDGAKIRESVRESRSKLKWGMAPTYEKEKMLCKMEQRKFNRYKLKRQPQLKNQRRRA